MSLRSDDADRKRKKREAERDLRISPVADLIRRRDCLADTKEFLRVYFGGIFSQPFTPNRTEMIEAIEHAAQYGGDQAIAAPRGDGKTRSALFVALKLMLEGRVRFPIIVSASGPRASRELKNLKEAIRDSGLLIQDFPEVFEPVIELGGWSSRARQQTAFGEYTHLEWGEDNIIFPTIPTKLLIDNGWNWSKSAAAGQIFSSLGIEGKIRGLSIRNERPDLAIIDDIDDRESARSALQTSTRMSGIEDDIGGLSGPDRNIARIMLCTKINDTCIASIYCDKKKKPSWRGRTYKLIEVWPTRMDLWEEYISLRQGRDDDDPDARKAHQFYLADRATMDTGAIVTNPYRFDARPLSNGEPGQVSALQACFDLIADRGRDHFDTEYQNEPPASEQVVTSGLTKELIQKRLSGLDRGQLPPDCKIVVGIDIGKVRCYWVACAFRKGAVGNILHYGSFKVHDTEDADDKTDKGRDLIDQAILDALIGWREEMASNPFRDADGNAVEISKVLIDSGYHPAPVYEMVRRYGDLYRASKGQSDEQFHPGRPSITRQVGNFWVATVQGGGWWLYQPNVDFWKRSVHERFLAEPLDDDGRPRKGSLALFAATSKQEHREYANHIMAEVWQTEFIPGKGEKSKFNKLSASNHLLDATALCLCGGEMIGMGVFSTEQQQQKPVVVSSGRSSQSRW